MNPVPTHDSYRIDWMRTLWEQTYRGTVFNSQDRYIATVRVILSVPLDREEVPKNAPEVAPAIIALIEDTVLSPIEAIDFEQSVSPIMAKQFSGEYFHPDRVMFFYPSPADGAETK